MPSPRAALASLFNRARIFCPLLLLAAPTTAWAECPVLGPSAMAVGLENAGDPLTDYFALVTIDTAAPIGLGLMRPDGQDLRAADLACNPLDFWVESGVNTAATRIWVKVPSVPTGASQFDIHFGHPSFTRTNQASDVFGPGLASLYTFTEGGGSTVTDWVGGHDLTVGAGLAWQSGPRPGVSGITGFATDRLLAADSGVALGSGDFTVFSAVSPTAPGGSTQSIIGAYGPDSESGWLLKLQGAAGQFMLLTNEAGIWCQTPGGALAANQWSLVGARRIAGGVNSLLQNGEVVADVCAGDTRLVDNPAVSFEIGRGYTGGLFPFQGPISLSAIYTSALSDQQIRSLHDSLFPDVHPTVTVAVVTITSAASTTFTVTSPGAFTFTAVGVSPDISVAGALPAGVAYNVATQAIEGTPVLGTVGTYPLTITATSELGVQTTQDFTLQVAKASQTVTLANPGPQHTGGPPTLLTASASSGLPVTFNSSTQDVCTVAGSTATMLAEGTCTIAADQPGGANFLPAPGVVQSFAVLLGQPQPPTNVRASVAGNRVALSWDESPGAPAADAFLVEVGDGPGRTTVTTMLTTRHTETGLLPRGDYYFRVRGMNQVGLSEPSDDVWVNVTASEPFAAPPIGLGAAISGSTLRLAWHDSPFGERPESYLLQVGTDLFSPPFVELPLPGGTREFTATNVPAGNYVLRLRTATSAGVSAPSSSVWIRVGTPALCSGGAGAPLLLTPVISDPLVGLSWLPPADETTASFVLHAGTGPGLSDVAVLDVGSVGGVGAVAGDGQYTIRAASASDCGPGAPSVEQTLTIGGPPPAAPTDLTATAGPGGVTFTWAPAASGAPATHYVLEAGLATGATLIRFPVGSTPSLTIPGVPSGLTFVARIRGANASGIGVASTEIVVTVP